MTSSFDIEQVRPGSRATFALALPSLPSGSSMTLPVCVLRGADEGPTVWISAAIHGDEINGTEIIRRILAFLDPKRMRGTLIAVPIVDVYGFNAATRYLPDRRDLNRRFPGSPRGSLAAQVAHMFTTQIVDRCDFGLDLHTGSDGRTNHPQLRGDTSDKTFMALAEAFAPPVILRSEEIEGSLRAYCVAKSIPYLIYEGGQAGRFDPDAVSAGFEGCLRVLDARGIVHDTATPALRPPAIAEDSSWIRSPASGIFVPGARLGDRVEAGQPVGAVGDVFGEHTTPVASPRAGIVIGLALDPLVEGGDAIVHLANV
jgi:predicted deacylase